MGVISDAKEETARSNETCLFSKNDYERLPGN